MQDPTFNKLTKTMRTMLITYKGMNYHSQMMKSCESVKLLRKVWNEGCFESWWTERGASIPALRSGSTKEQTYKFYLPICFYHKHLYTEYNNIHQAIFQTYSIIFTSSQLRSLSMFRENGCTNIASQSAPVQALIP